MTEICDGLWLRRRRNGIVGIPEWQVVHESSGLQVAAIGDAGEEPEVVAAAFADHFTADFTRPADVVRADPAAEEQASAVWRVRQRLRP
jgi:hypothetical protein